MPPQLEPFDAWSVDPPWRHEDNEIDWKGGKRPGVLVSRRQLMVLPTPWAIVAPKTHSGGRARTSVSVADDDPSGLGPGSIKCDQLIGLPVIDDIFLSRRGSFAHLGPEIRNAVRYPFDSCNARGYGIQAGDIVRVNLDVPTVCVVVSSGRANATHPLALATVVQTVAVEHGDKQGARSFPLEGYVELLGERRLIDTALIRTIAQRRIDRSPHLVIARLTPADLAALILLIRRLLA